MRRVLFAAVAVLAASSVAGAATCRAVKSKTWPTQIVKTGHPGDSASQAWFEKGGDSAPNQVCSWGTGPVPATARDAVKTLDAAVWEVTGYAGQKGVIQATINAANPTFKGSGHSVRVGFKRGDCQPSGNDVLDIPVNNTKVTFTIPTGTRWVIAEAFANGTMTDVTIKLSSPGKKCPKRRR